MQEDISRKPETDSKSDKKDEKGNDEEKKQGPDLNAVPPGCSISGKDLTKIVAAYVSRETKKEMSDLKLIGELGGLDGVASKINVDHTKGIPVDQVEQRRSWYGSNAKEKPKLRTIMEILCDVLQDLMLRILLVASIATIVINEIVEDEDRSTAWIDGVAIFFAVLVVCLVTTINDYKKERQFLKLTETAEAEKLVHCMRPGQEQVDIQVGSSTEKQAKKVHVDDLVVGDIVQIETGKTIPGDAILISGKDIEMDESAATGESKTLKKMSYAECLQKLELVKQRHPEDISTSFSSNCVPSPVLLSGTKVFKGTGQYMIIVVGDISFMGEIRKSLEEEATTTPLQDKLTAVAEQIGTLGLVAAIATVVAMLLSYFITRIRDGGWESDDIGLCFSYLVLGITVLVVAIPEGLPLAVTISLAYSVMKMYEQQNFVKTLMACETMGEVNNICTDKTGTLTKNLMSVLEVWFDGVPFNVSGGPEKLRQDVPEPALNRLLEILSCNINMDDANATEKGFQNFLVDCKYPYADTRKRLMPTEESYNRILFTSERKKSTTIIKMSDGDWLYTFGNVLKILQCCSKIYKKNGQEAELTPQISESLSNDIKTANGRALRTLGVAYKKLAQGEGGDDHLEKNEKDAYTVEETGLTFVGYLGLRDQLRDKVADAVGVLTGKAGITVRMVTGDNIETAIAIAKECGILHADQYKESETDMAMTGETFAKRVGEKTYVCRKCKEAEKSGKPEEKRDQETIRKLVQAEEKQVVIEMKEQDKKKENKDEKKCPRCGTTMEITASNMEEFAKIVQKLRVIASCRPNDKYLLVAGLKYLGNVVGVTGDGSNDAPALKKADIGLAMNAGTDLAKDAAGIVLLDNNFASIQTAVNWGRNIFDSIRKFIQFQISTNIVALVLAFVGSCIICQSPLTTVQLLWINLIMDSLASLALATDSPTPDQLERPPVGKEEHIITKRMMKNILGQAAYMITVLLIILLAGEYFIPEDCYEEEYEGVMYNYCNADGYVRTGRRFAYDRSESDSSLYSQDVKRALGPSRHLSVLYTVFVYLQLFNQINARKLTNELNIFSGFFSNRIAIPILIFEFGVQIILTEFGGDVFSLNYRGLTWQQWLISIAFALGTWVVRAFLTLFDFKRLPEVGGNEVPAKRSFYNRSNSRIVSERLVGMERRTSEKHKI